MRRFGETPRANKHYIRRPGVYAILARDRQLLLTHQSSPSPELQLPGGGVDPGESSVKALHREVLEETGWIIAKPRRLGAYKRFTFMPEYDLWAEKICTIYLAFPVRPLGPPTEPDHAPLWTSYYTAAESLDNSGDRYFVKRLLGLA